MKKEIFWLCLSCFGKGYSDIYKIDETNPIQIKTLNKISEEYYYWKK